MKTDDDVKPIPVDEGNLLPEEYDPTGFRTFVMVDADAVVMGEGIEFSDGRVVLMSEDGSNAYRYTTGRAMVRDWFGRGFPVSLAAVPPSELYRPRRFILHRLADATGFSGTGIAVEGVQFTHGGVLMMWLGELRSLVEWASIEEVVTTHGHRGDTQLVWLDPA